VKRLTLNQAAVLAYIEHWCKVGTRYKDDEGYQWIDYTKMLKDLGPLIGYKTTSGIAWIVAQLKKDNYITTKMTFKKIEGSYSRKHIWFKTNNKCTNNKCVPNTAYLYSIIEESITLNSTDVVSDPEFIDI